MQTSCICPNTIVYKFSKEKFATLEIRYENVCGRKERLSVDEMSNETIVREMHFRSFLSG